MSSHKPRTPSSCFHKFRTRSSCFHENRVQRLCFRERPGDCEKCAWVFVLQVANRRCFSESFFICISMVAGSARFCRIHFQSCSKLRFYLTWSSDAPECEKLIAYKMDLILAAVQMARRAVLTLLDSVGHHWTALNDFERHPTAVLLRKGAPKPCFPVTKKNILLLKKKEFKKKRKY